MLVKSIVSSLLGLALPFSGLLLASNGEAQSFSFYDIDVPSSTLTTAFGINPAGDIVGTYNDTVGGQHGFLLSHGRFTTIDVPGGLVGAIGTLPTVARGINPEGDIVGSFTAPVSAAPATSLAYCPAATSTYCIKGFLYSHGEFSLVLFPGHVGAIAQRITPTGDIYGCLHDFNMMSTMYGFGISHFGDTSLQLNGGELSDSTKSVPASMDTGATPDGSIRVGLYIDMMTGFNHGYLIRNGILQTYDVPGPLQTNIYDINPAGDFVGIYIGSGGNRHGFFQPADGSAPITLTYPDAVHTRAFGVNPSQAVVGLYVDTSGHTHGFLGTPVPSSH